MNATANNLPDYVPLGEARAAARLVNELVEAGYIVSVHDGGEYTVRMSNDPATIVAALASTGMDTLTIRDTKATTERPESGRNTAPVVGSILLVWGNAEDGSELVSDWSWTDSTAAGRAFNAFMDARS